MFEDFETKRIDTGDVEIHLRTAGHGPPVLLLHGYPQTHVTWHRVAPVLAEQFTVVVPDLRGYGDSGCPPSDPDHHAYSKRAMGDDMVAVMEALGFGQFAVVGHDRGARVTYRMALDHPDRVTRMASLDIIPTLEMWRRTDKARAMGAFHWMFLAQPAPKPETMIGHDPDYFLEWLLESWAADPAAFAPQAMAEYKRCFRKPEVIHATCEDYRAGATVDVEYDVADQEAGLTISCPLLALWGDKRAVGGPASGDGLEIWRKWADDVSGGPVACGHFLPEEAPEAVLEQLLPFLGGS